MHTATGHTVMHNSYPYGAHVMHNYDRKFGIALCPSLPLEEITETPNLRFGKSKAMQGAKRVVSGSKADGEGNYEL